MPSTANGISPIRISTGHLHPVGRRQAHAERDAGDVQHGDAHRGDRGSPLASLVPKYVRMGSGLTRSWRFHPIDRSAAMRAPPAMTAAIVPQLTMPAM